jgi:hypothetical protein
MGNLASTLASEKTLPNPYAEDYGVRQERFRLGMEGKVREFRKQMMWHADQKFAIEDRVKYQLMLQQIARKING